MDRRLILMRHAKSSWKDASLDDHERPLNKRGKQDAPRVARRIDALGWAPELVVSSDSRRTRQTWKRMREQLPGEIDAVFTRTLYCAGLEQLMAESHGWDPAVRTVLVLGHNPGWEQALSSLIQRPERMATANAALLRGSGASWVKALSGRWQLVELIRPRELPD